jgi:tRNA-2-methylthio-N6-dimethylallyladenosine synthase
MSKKLLIKTWGCQMNEYDSSRMVDLLSSDGYELTEIPEEADVLLLNTCSIREKAQEKVFHQLGRWKNLKDKNEDIVIGVGGCRQPGRGPHPRACSVCGRYLRPANPAPPAAYDQSITQRTCAGYRCLIP